MEPKDLENSEELKVTVSNDSEVNENLQSGTALAHSGDADDFAMVSEPSEIDEAAEAGVSDVLAGTAGETLLSEKISEPDGSGDAPKPGNIVPKTVEPETTNVTTVLESEVSIAEEADSKTMADNFDDSAGEDVKEESDAVIQVDLPSEIEEVVSDDVVIPGVTDESSTLLQQDEQVENTDFQTEEVTDEENVILTMTEEDTSPLQPDEHIEGDVLQKEEEVIGEDSTEVTLISTEADDTGKVPEGREDESTEEKEAGEVKVSTDYSRLSQFELVTLLREVVEGNPEGQVHNADAIVAVFYRKSREEGEEGKRNFIAEGGKAEDYIPEEEAYSDDVKELLKKYRQQKFEQVKKLDAEKEINLRNKYEIIEEIKNLLNKEESINRTFQEFRDLQKRWYEIGQVPQAKMKDLWDTYHFHVENFYDYIKINKELRDLDLKKNLELKMEICEKAEELLVEPSVIKAFNALQKLHEEWRETGPVPSDKKDEIWERFKATTSKINLKHQEYFEKRKQEQKKNLDAKIALCEKAEEIVASNLEAHREWDEKSRELIELQKVWKTIGFAPKRENNKVYDRFRSACDKFFINKREYYSKNKDIQQLNLQMKIDLCLEAETLKESTDWKKATQQFIDIQKRWKEIGPIPRKSSDAVWKRFRAACDYFFEKKALHFNDIDGEQLENLKLKEHLITEVENFKADSDSAVSLKTLRDFQRRWTEIGHVPIKSKDAVQRRFREAINRQFDTLKVDTTNRSVFNFRSKIESLTENARGLSKVRSEREKYMAKLKQLETDLTLLDNNIGFFANSKNAQVLIADVNQKIIDTREKIEQLKEKIRIIDDLDKSEY